MKLDPLSKLAYKYGTDKCPQINHCYTPFYYELLKNKKQSIKKVLEIGIGISELERKFNPTYITGASLFMWRDFFPNAVIYGADIDPRGIFKSERIQTFLCDETKKEDLKNLIKKTGNDIDLFIDDGSHVPRDQNFSLQTLMPLLNKGVIYIIEDVNRVGPLSCLTEYNYYIPKLPQKIRLRKAGDRIIVVKHK